MDQLHDRQDREYRQVILDWLTKTDYAPRQSEIVSRRQEGSGQWLLNSDIFKNWVSQSKQTLFCPGIPGAGKTVITSIVVEHLLTEFQNDINIGIAYIYCNYRRREKQKLVDLLESLLKQLVQKQPSMPESIKSLYKHHRDRGTSPPLVEILRVLYSVVANYSRVFIIIDALDECQVFGGDRSRLLSEIFNLQVETEVNFFATSRFIPEVMAIFQGSMMLEIRASDEDVLEYVDEQISQSTTLKSIISKYPGLQDTIRTKIVKAADGMFLLAQLYMVSLTNQQSLRQIKRALQDLTQGMKDLDEIYYEAMERIECQTEESRQLAKQVLSWVTCARRPLTTLELQHALAVEVGEPRFDEENLPEIEDMVSVCAGLVIVDEGNIIRLAHYTTQDFFERIQTSWFPNAQTDIAATCVTYLSFDVFAAGFRLTDEEFEAELRLHPLYDYAARNWGDHARAASTEMEKPILGLLESEAKVSAASQAMLASRSYSGYSQRVPRQMTGVHLAAYFGLTGVIIALLQNRYNPDVRDTYDRSPLSWAAENGHEAVVKLLLEKGAELEFKDREGWTPLSRAAERGHEAVVRLLLVKGADLESRDEYGQTPLLWAAASGHEAVVKLLLEKGAELESTDREGQAPLWRAAGHGHEAVVKLLLEKGANLESRDEHGQTPLSRAAERGHKAVVELLLEKGAKLESKDRDGQTPLWRAAECGHEAVVKLLLAKYGIVLDFEDNNNQMPLWRAVLLAMDEIDPDYKNSMLGQTPLWRAARDGRKTMVELLLAKGDIGPDSSDDDGRTPLSWAAENGHETVVKLLLEKNGVNPDSRDQHGQTPLSWASANGQAAAVKLLLARDSVKTDAEDDNGRTPLSWATGHGYEAVVKLLLAEDGVDVNSRDHYGQTPLSWAAANGHEAVVKLLLKNGAKLEYKDGDSQTPLLWAARNGHEAVVKLLLAKDGIDSDARDDNSRTPLSWGAGNGYEAVVKLLLAKDDVDLNSRDHHGQTPLSWASRNGHEEIVKVLLVKDGVDLNVKDTNYGQTPLCLAAQDGCEAVVKLLLAKDGVDLNPEDHDGQTPLSWASRNGHDAVIKQLLARDNVNPNTKDKHDQAPLSWAAENGHIAAVKLLLAKKGIDPNVRDATNGRTPLCWAAQNGYEGIVKLLLDIDGVNPDAEDTKFHRTPLCWATQNRHEAVMKLLLAKDNVDPNTKDKYGKAPLSWAAENGHTVAVKLLLAKDNVDPNTKDTYGKAPLSWAAEYGHIAVVKLLLAKDDIEPNVKDATNGRTPLCLAARNGHEAVVKLLLLAKGVNPQSEDTEGWTPLSWAASERHLAVVELLINSDTITLGMLVQKRNQRLVKTLLDAGYNANAPDPWKRTPLHHALLFEEFDIATELISSRNIKVDSEDVGHRTPLHLAIRKKKGEIIRLLLNKGAHTRRIMAKDWRDAFEKPQNVVLLSEEREGEKSVQFIAKKESAPAKISTPKKRLFLFPKEENLIVEFKDLIAEFKDLMAELNDSSKPYQLKISPKIPPNKSEGTKLFVGIWFPLRDPNLGEPFMMSADEKVMISWTIFPFSDIGQKAIDHFSTLPYGSIPDHHIDFFSHFILHLKEKWLELCSLEERHLTDLRREVLAGKGKISELIERLLKDAEKWTQFHRILQDQVDVAGNFHTQYSDLDYENEADDKALDELEKTINSFAEKVNNRITQLDGVYQSLIQIEFNLTSIAEVQDQADIGRSQKELTAALTRDSANMKLIAILTALFLPGTFMAVLLTTPMFKWPDPPDGQIIVRLPFEIYWAASLSITLILGSGMYIWSVMEKPLKWPKTVKAVWWVSAGKLFADEVKGLSANGSDHEKSEQDSQVVSETQLRQQFRRQGNSGLSHV